VLEAVRLGLLLVGFVLGLGGLFLLVVLGLLLLALA
jgi:hypothetical protein